MFIVRNFTAEPLFAKRDSVAFSDYDPAPGTLPSSGDIAVWLVADFAAAQRPGWTERLRDLALEAVSSCDGHPDRTLHVFPIVSVHPLDAADRSHVHRWELTDLNSELRSVVSEHPNMYWVGLESLLAEFGGAAFDERLWYATREPFSAQFVAGFPKFWDRYLAACQNVRKKVLVLDLDNTLWGGVLGEDGVQGIAIGGAYPGNAFLDVQGIVKSLYERGVLLSIASKNDEEPVWEALEQRSEMLLERDMFLHPQIHWEDKPGSLVAIADSLNLGLDSMVFVDDSPQERLFVKQSLPEVAVPELPRQAYELPSALRYIADRFFASYHLTGEDRVRTQLYNAEIKRESSRRDTDLQTYLATLDTQLSRIPITPDAYHRLSQLTQKTNQFNMTTERLDPGAIGAWHLDPQREVMAFRVSDVYSEQGLSAVLLAHYDGKTGHIDNFLMSCRLLGRQIESAILKYALEQFGSQGCTEAVGHFRATARNGRAQSFYAEHGFTEKTPETWVRELSPSIQFTGLEELVSISDAT